MATYSFDLLDLADGEAGEAAVSVVVGKKIEAAYAAVKVADAAEKIANAAVKVANTTEPAAQEKSKNFYYTKLQHDEGVRICQQDLKKLRDAMRKLRGEETKMREQPGNEARLKELSDEQWKLRKEQMKLRQQEATLVQQKKVFYEENGIPLPEEMNPNNNSHGANAVPGSNYNGANGNVYNNNDGGSCGYSDYGGNNDHYQTQVCDGGEHYPHGHDHYNNGDRQGYCQDQPRMKEEYVPKAKASSDAGEEKPETNVVSANGTEQKEASADNADAVPASESDKSATGGAAQDGLNNGQGARPSTKYPFRKEKLNGSEKRKKKNAKKNSGTELEKVKKQDSEVDNSTKQADKQPLQEEKKTLAEYERTRDEKNKASVASKTEVRKVTAEAFEGLQMLERKKLDYEEAVIKVEKAQPKVKEASKKKEVQAEGKEAAVKDGKPKKVIVPRQNLGFKPARRVTYDQEDGSRGRFNGGFQGSRRDNSTKPRVNGRAVQNDSGSHNGNGAPMDAYNGRGNGASRGDYSGHRDTMGNGGYSYGRGNGGYGYGRGNGGYQGSGGYQQQQGGNVGRYQQERAGNGGNYPQRRPGNDTYYQQRGNSGDRRSSEPAPAPDMKLDMSLFPALPAPASALSSAPAQASSPAAAPAQA
ncbi:unnamed protein product [Urochloa humidicola]